MANERRPIKGIKQSGGNAARHEQGLKPQKGEKTPPKKKKILSKSHLSTKQTFGGKVVPRSFGGGGRFSRKKRIV